ncbi:hypothetical protein BY458DRAFT_505364 [Sporodiniella umbellata]|nr:hypothetical protein BY458DRAFT_505364 [Sporodiniella umbellata]
MLSLNHMLNDRYKRPAMLDITNLLNNDYPTQGIVPKSPSLSPSLSSSPTSVSSVYSGCYPFSQQDYWDLAKEDMEDNEEEDDEEDDEPVKAKRRRANSEQLQVLNRVFDRTFFPSTQVRAELGRQLNMNPRTVQIWFQNRRQAMRTKERQRLLKLTRK